MTFLIHITLFPPLTIMAAGAKPLPSLDVSSGIFVETSISTKTPYVLQPIFYTVKLYTKHDANHIVFSPLKTEKLSIKQNGTYNTYPTKYLGETVSVIELNYIITPLRSGKVTIPATKITGNYIKHKATKVSTPFDLDFEEENQNKPTSKSQNLELESKLTHINILPTPTHVQPWLPANSISLKDEIIEGNLNIGTPITRTITIVASGLRGNQLPSLAEQFVENEDYKIYSENPEISEKIEKDTIIGTRKEAFIIIPQKPGKIVFPSITVKWWNLSTSKLQKSGLPSKTLEIMPNLLEPGNIQALATETIVIEESQEDRIWLWCGLGFLIIGFLWILKSPGRGMTLSLCKSTKDINEFLRNYGEEKLNLPRNSSLEMILSRLCHPEDNYKHFIRKLENALYYEQNYDLIEIKKELAKILKHSKKDKKSQVKKRKAELPGLNPR